MPGFDPLLFDEKTLLKALEVEENAAHGEPQAAMGPPTCANCTHNRGQDWPERYAHIYAPFPHRRADMIFCAASREVTHPALDRRKGSMSYCPHWEILTLND